jgi:hypothetical protein
MSKIALNSDDYALTGEIQQSYVAELSTAFRTVGTQRRQDNQKVNRYPHQGFLLGVGYPRMDRETGDGVGGMRWSTAETRWRNISLAYLPESQTHSLSFPVDHLKKYVSFKGDYWGIFEDDYASGAVTGIAAAKFGGSSDNWTGGSNIENMATAAHGKRMFDAVVHKGKIHALGSGDGPGDLEGMYRLWDSIDGSTWQEASGTGFPGATVYLTTTTTRRNNFDDDMGKLLSFGNTLLAAIYEDPDASGGSVSQIRVYYSVNGGDNYTAGAVIPSGTGPKAFVKFTDRTGTVVPVLVTQENIYTVASAGTTFEELLPLSPVSGDAADGRWATVASDGKLYVPLGSGEHLAVTYMGDGAHDITQIGFGTRAGVPTSARGHTNFILDTPSPWLFVAFGGHAADTNATIMALDKRTVVPGKGQDAAWHHIYTESDADIDITMVGYSSEDDATPRLHFALENASASEMFHIEEILQAPDIRESSSKFQATSYIELPEDDLGDPQNDSTIIQALIDVDNLSSTTSGEYIQHQYGVNGAAYTNVDLGDYLSGDKALSFGSGSGVAAKTIKNRLDFFRDSGDTTQSPVLKEFELQAKQKAQNLRAWSVVIDIEDTARIYGGGAGDDSEAVITTLETVFAATVMFPMSLGFLSSVAVEVRQPPVWTLRVVEVGESGYGRRTGTVAVVLEEVTPGVTGIGSSTVGVPDISSGHTWTANQIYNDDVKLLMGTGSDSQIYYDGNDLIINTSAVGSGNLSIVGGSLELDDSEALIMGTGEDATLLYDGTNVVLNVAAVGSGEFVLEGGRLETDDNEGVVFGTGNDAHVRYDGTDLVISPASVGSGDVVISGGSLELDDSESLTLGTGKDATLLYDGTDLVISPAAVGSGDVVISGGSLELADSESLTLGTGKDVTLLYNGTNTVFNLQAVGSGSLIPGANDGGGLGASGTAFSDLFLASGAVVNFNAGDVTLTHSSNALVIAGGSTTVDALLSGSDDGGAIGASGTAFSDLFLASGAVVNFNSGDVILTHASNLLTMAGGNFAMTGSSSGVMTFAPAASVTDYTVTYPAAQGGASQVLLNDGAGALSWSALAGGGDVIGPASATDNAIARYNATSGTSVQNSGVLINDSNNVSGIGTLASGAHTVTGAVLPNANNGGALGASGTAWADLFLADGGVVNFNAGDVSLTHSANTLTLSGGNLALGAGIDLVFSGTTGTNDITLTDSVADALSIVRGSTDFMVFNTSTPLLTITPAVTVTGIVTAATGSIFGTLTVGSGSITDSSGALSFGNENLATTGTLASGALTVTGAALPNTNNGGALGAAGTGWSDLFFAEGAVINWDSGDLTLTQANNVLTLAGGALVATLTSPVLNTGVSGTAVLDEDDLSTNSATQLATQQSIKAYVDAGGGQTTYDAVVDAAGGGDYATLQAAEDALDGSSHYTVYVKQGAYSTVNISQSGGCSWVFEGKCTFSGVIVVAAASNAVNLVFGPGCTFAAAINLTGTDCSIYFGAGCDLDGELDMDGVGGTVTCENGCDLDYLTIAAYFCSFDGGGWDTVIDGTTANHAVSITSAGQKALVSNVAVQTTAGGGSSYDGVSCASGSCVITRVRVVASDDVGIHVFNAANQSRVYDCEIRGTDDSGIKSEKAGVIIQGNWMEGIAGIGIEMIGDNSVVTGNVVGPTITGDSIDLASGSDNNVVVANRIEGAVDDNGGGNTVASNDNSAF